MRSISVALCTFNGARFLPEQLASIAAQTQWPDELVVCDDGSTDNTLDLVRAFAATAPFPVRVQVNPDRLGSTGNFAQAVSLCTGDLIALADQDDVWRPEKLARLEHALRDQPGAGLVFSDATMVDERLRSLGYTLWEAVEFRPRERRQFRDGQAFPSLLRRYRVTGATMAFRAACKNLVLPIPGQWVHDAWIALLIAAVAPVALVEEPLLLYRQHAGQQLGERKRGLLQQYRVARSMTRESYQAVVERFTEARDRLRGVPELATDRMRLLSEKIVHFQQRVHMRDPRIWRLPLIAREWWQGRYRRYSLGWKSLAQDLFLS